MNALKKYKLVHNSPAHFILHDGIATFHVAKKGLDPEMLGKIESMPKQDIKHLAYGGYANEEITPQYKLDEQVEEADRISQKVTEGYKHPESYFGGDVKHFNSGGEAEEESNIDYLGRKLKETFKTPLPPPVKHQETLEEKNDRIRKESHKDFMGEAHQYSEGGRVPDHNMNAEAMEKETANLNTPKEYAEFIRAYGHNLGANIQHLDVGGTAQGLPLDFEDQVQKEKQALAINDTAMPPQNIDNSNIVPKTAQPMNPDAFQSQAETNVAQQFQEQQDKLAAGAEMAKAAALQAQMEQNNKIASDNEIRARAGLPPIPAITMPDVTGTSAQTISPAQQVSFKPPQQSQQGQPSSGSQSSMLGNFDKALNQMQGGIQKNAQLQAQGLEENARNVQAYLDDQRQRQADYQVEHKKIQDENTELFNKVRDSKIDPNRIWSNASTGRKISATLGLIFGGIGSGLTHQPNLAAEFLQKAIASDIDAQKADQSNNMNLYKLGLEKYKDAESAEKFAMLQAQTMLAGQIQQTAAKIGSPQAKALAQQAIGELHLKYDPIRNDLALKQTALNYGQTPGVQQSSGSPQAGINTGKMTAFMNAGLYDAETKKELIKEQGEYTKVKNHLDQTDRVFRDAAKNATYTDRLASAIPGGSLIPTTRESTKQYHSAVNSYLDKMTKDLTGRVTPQSMENLHSSMPVAGDEPDTLARKANDLKDIIKAAYSFPTLTNKGLLNPNDPVLQTTGGTDAKFKQGKPVIK